MMARLASADYRAQSSKSRIITATWARFAASARRLKLLRNGSVEASVSGTGAGWKVMCEGDCCEEDVEVALEAVVMMGAFIVDSFVCEVEVL